MTVQRIILADLFIQWGGVFIWDSVKMLGTRPCSGGITATVHIGWYK